jgi:Protein of unknown function (DUF551)
MSHKFEVGEIVFFKKYIEDEFYIPGKIVYKYSKEFDPSSSSDVYRLVTGNTYVEIKEEALRKYDTVMDNNKKIEECKCGGSNGHGKCACQKNKYQIGDLVNFRAKNNTISKGILKRCFYVAGSINYTVELSSQTGVSFNIMESQIISKIDETEQLNSSLCQDKKYKIGDRVIFYFTEDEVKIGIIEEIDIHGTCKIIFGDTYYIIPEKDIIAKSEINQQPLASEEEFKVGDEVWVKAKVSPWDGCFNHGEIFSPISNCISININDNSENRWVNLDRVVKSLPPKNEWINIKDKMPEIDKSILVFEIEGYQCIARCKPNGIGSFVFRTSCGIPVIVTHWKTLDEPPKK